MTEKQIELATSILEGHGYTVTKDLTVQEANARLLVERADADKHIASLQDQVAKLAAERGVLRMKAQDEVQGLTAALADHQDTIAALREELAKRDTLINQKDGDIVTLFDGIRKCLDDHIARAEKGGNTRGAMQLRAAANLLGVILRGEEPGTACPEATDPRGEVIEDPLESRNEVIEFLESRNEGLYLQISRQAAELARQDKTIEGLRGEISELSAELTLYQEADDVGSPESKKIRETEATIESQSKLVGDLSERLAVLKRRGDAMHETGRAILNRARPLNYESLKPMERNLDAALAAWRPADYVMRPEMDIPESWKIEPSGDQ